MKITNLSGSPVLFKAWAVVLFLVVGLPSLLAQDSAMSKQQAIDIIVDDRLTEGLDRSSTISLLNTAISRLMESDDTCFLIRALSRRSMELGNDNQQELGLDDIQLATRLLSTSSCDTGFQIYIDLARVGLLSDMRDQEGMAELALKSLKRYRASFIDSLAYLKFMFATGYNGGNLADAIRYQDTAYQWAMSLGNVAYQQRALLNAGAYHAWNGDLEAAKEYFLKALEYVRLEKKYLHIASLYNNLAGLSQEPGEVLLYIDSAIFYAGKSESLDILQTYTENKAIYYTMIGDYENAYLSIYNALVLNDSLLNQEKILAVAEMREKFEAEKKNNEIQGLKLEKLEAETRFQTNRNRLLVGLFLLVSLAGFLATRYYVSNKHRNILEQKNLELSIAHQRSDQLLLNILPEEVATELKQKGQAEAKVYDMATILFTDFIDFTKGVAKLSSEQLLEELNFYFRAFDEIIERYQVEKIKTIGDSYMAVGGLPTPFDDSVKYTVLAALEMQVVVKKRNDHLGGEGIPSFEMRIGVNTGPIVAGIVGVKKFQYDVWGDAVNTASRLENTSEAGRVNISQTTYDLIVDCEDEQTGKPLFKFESRGKIAAKGKGEIAMYFVSRNTGAEAS